MVHAEVVLERHRGVGLGGVFHAHAFLGLDGLVQAVGVAAALHHAAGLLIHNLHLAVVGQDVLVVLLKQRVGFEQLVHGVHPLALVVVVAHQLVLAGQLFLGGSVIFLDGRNLHPNVGHDEQAGVFALRGNEVDALFGQLNLVVFLVDGEVQGHVGLRHLARIVAEVVRLGGQQHGPHPRLAQKLDEGLALGQAAVGAEEQQAALAVLVALFHARLALLNLLAGLH